MISIAHSTMLGRAQGSAVEAPPVEEPNLLSLIDLSSIGQLSFQKYQMDGTSEEFNAIKLA